MRKFQASSVEITVAIHFFDNLFYLLFFVETKYFSVVCDHYNDVSKISSLFKQHLQ